MNYTGPLMSQITDDVNTTLESVIGGMEELCVTEAFAVEKNNNTDPVLIVKEIEQNICPSQCSGHGECQNSLCTCDEGNK